MRCRCSSAEVGFRERRHGIGWIEPELMRRTIDITFAQTKPDKPVK